MPTSFLRLPLDKLRPLWYNTRVIRVRVVYTDYTKIPNYPKDEKMNIVTFDTETISTTKPFVYNIGYVISDEDGNTIISHDFIVSETWNNKMLFNTAYYADKQNIYISRMKGKQVVKRKWLDIITLMAQEFETYNVQHGYACNSDFDERVFAFNADWFKTFNPLENVKVHDIRGYAHKAFCHSDDYADFCEKFGLFTDSGNYSSTAETLFKYVTGETDFEEEHTALADSVIELDVLLACRANGCDLLVDYPVSRTLPRRTLQTLTVRTMDGEEVEFEYHTKTNRNGKIYLK